jgi:hypothetical protein
MLHKNKSTKKLMMKPRINFTNKFNSISSKFDSENDKELQSSPQVVHEVNDS